MPSQQMGTSVSHRRATYLTIFFGALFWCGLIVLPPLCAGPFALVADALYQFFHPICHQLDDRCFHLLGKPLAVCERCSAIYGAFFLGTLLYPLFPDVGRSWSPRPLLVVATLPMILDVATGFVGIHEVTMTTRIATGFLFGFVLPFIIIPAASDAVEQLFKPGSVSTSSQRKDISHA
jgi:uncharacterized membrane protein